MRSKPKKHSRSKSPVIAVAVVDALLRLAIGTRIRAFAPNPWLAAALTMRYWNEYGVEVSSPWPG